MTKQQRRDKTRQVKLWKRLIRERRWGEMLSLCVVGPLISHFGQFSRVRKLGWREKRKGFRRETFGESPLRAMYPLWKMRQELRKYHVATIP